MVPPGDDAEATADDGTDDIIFDPGAAPPGDSTSFKCYSPLNLGRVAKASQKGMVLDDNTLSECAGTIPAFFPNTETPIKNLRLLKAWDPEWSPEGRLPAWSNLVDFVKANGVQVFLGTEVTCNEDLDAKSWTWTKQLLEMLGPAHVMGLSIGNELDALYTLGDRRKAAPVTPECISALWGGGRLWKHFQAVVEEFDFMGFRSKPVTSALGQYALAGRPFVDTAESQVNTFLSKASRAYGHRFVFTFNFSPYFDTNMHMDDAGEGTCQGALHDSVNWQFSGFVPKLLRMAREGVTELAPLSKVWLGETGWSSPLSKSLTSAMQECGEWSAKSTLRNFYSGFLGWDMSGVDQVFYFSVRDSSNYGVREHFGLISSCCAQACKLQPEEEASAEDEAEELPGDDFDQLTWAF